MIEEDDEEPLINDIFKPNFEEPQLKEKVEQVTQQILKFQQEIRGKVTRQQTKKIKKLILETTQDDLEELRGQAKHVIKEDAINNLTIDLQIQNQYR